MNCNFNQIHNHCFIAQQKLNMDDNRDISQDSPRNFVIVEIIIDGVLDPLNEGQSSENAENSQPTEFSVELFSGSPPFTN
ncbi:hypothetical protein C2G38_2189209 [Gigaspora rosea]|uniref:Uncharacterized protein n=1 Tax=Gigaspora rosea TaxID=44941 RepID=A0A397VBM9_9GLOM|nr:hypothetical protein C2G38_2189209 [Gigaspora rosea]